MTFSPHFLLGRLAELEEIGGLPERYVVAFSGGLDSTVLLYALAATRETHGKDIVAVYVDHGLQRQSVAWGEHCSEFAAAHGVGGLTIGKPFDILHHGGQG